MTNKEKALALINTFVTGDTAKAKELLAPGYAVSCVLTEVWFVSEMETD